MIKMFKNIIFVGDIHGDINQIAYHQKLHKLTDTVYIQLGDFGIGFKNQFKEKQTLDYFNKIFKLKGNFLYAARGNHDCPAYFHGDFDTTNIKLVPDYTVHTFNVNEVNLNILFMGGAVSIDRMTRKGYITNGEMGMDYWKGEEFLFNRDKLKIYENIDIVITHTAPDICLPIGTSDIVEYYKTIDSCLEEDLKIERDLLTQTYNILKENNSLKYWFYGHFHNTYQDIKNDTKFICVDMNRFYSVQYF